ncbi:phosphate/phosphite/phosphonate ABC transporter substrate-binding protein [Oryzifoliimicrobium ureilyticus]|uniref:phosphate/phosphite/phosphonate ABC transporter substrate-binding protein n=1 Tax=Oryzifoliimicrobium ureilyticus TaxID=3113724 RepID=UPI0030764E95
MSIASIRMYTSPRELADATSKLWSFLSKALRAQGQSDVPDHLSLDIAHDEAWLRPDLLLSQTCGYPYVTSLRGRVRLVATPIYRYPGCSGPSMRSFIITRRALGLRRLEDLRGTVAAINSHDSNSGANLFRASMAPLAAGKPFFERVITTGGHRASIDAVVDGSADCAAIDCITFANIKRFDPQALERIVILDETISGPGLPFITKGQANDLQVERLRQALFASIDASALDGVRDTLGLIGFEILSDSDYEPLQALAERAHQSGFHDF